MKSNYGGWGLMMALLAMICASFSIWPLVVLLGLLTISIWLEGVGERIAELFEMPKGKL